MNTNIGKLFFLRKDTFMDKERAGNKNSNWKGSEKNISRRALHYRVQAKRGKASQYKCAKCHKNQATDWADLGNGKFSPYCRSCHNTKDKKIKNIHNNDSRYKSLREEILDLATGW